jgi:hypothetical protein
VREKRKEKSAKLPPEIRPPYWKAAIMFLAEVQL